MKEFNDHDGWCYFIPYIDNTISEKTFETFSNRLYYSDNFDLCETELSEDGVDLLVSRNKFSGGYMTPYNKCYFIVSESHLVNFNDKFQAYEEGIIDVWYKGGIQNYCWESDSDSSNSD